jgi:hypothetical protein
MFRKTPARKRFEVHRAIEPLDVNANPAHGTHGEKCQVFRVADVEVRTAG